MVKNVGPSQLLDLQESIQPNLKQVMINYKQNSGETTSSTLKLKNGNKKTQLKLEKF